MAGAAGAPVPAGGPAGRRGRPTFPNADRRVLELLVVLPQPRFGQTHIGWPSTPPRRNAAGGSPAPPRSALGRGTSGPAVHEGTREQSRRGRTGRPRFQRVATGRFAGPIPV